MVMPSLGQILLMLFFLALACVAEWFGRHLAKRICHCDDSDQGRKCRNCTPPHIPRIEL